MSAPSTTPPTTRVEVPLGSRVLVRSRLDLTLPATEDTLRSVARFAEDLERWQGTGVVVVAGGLVAAQCAAALDEVLEAHLELRTALKDFESAPGRSLHLLDAAVGEELVLACTTASGVHEVLVTAEPCPRPPQDETERAEDAEWLDGIELVCDPEQRRRFATSRALYRRLGSLLWVPPLLAALAAVIANLAFVDNGLRRIVRSGRVITEVTEATVGQRLVAIGLGVAIVELLVGASAVVLARAAFTRQRGRAQAPPAGSDVDEELSAGARRGGPDHDGPGPRPAGPGAGGRDRRGGQRPVADPPRRRLRGRARGDRPGRARAPRAPGAPAGVPRPPPGRRRAPRDRRGSPRPAPGHRRDGPLGPPLRAPRRRRADRAHPGQRPLGAPRRQLASWRCLASPRRPGPRPGPGHEDPPHRGAVDLPDRSARPPPGDLTAAAGSAPPGAQHPAPGGGPDGGGRCGRDRPGPGDAGPGVRRGQRRAWLAAVILLAASTVLHLAHAINIGAVLISSGVLVLLLVERRYFTATTDRTSLAKATPVLITIVLVAIGAAFLGVELSNLHTGALVSWPLVLVAVTERLVGLETVSLPDRVNDFVYPTMLTVGIAVLLTALYLITRPVVDRRISNQDRATERRIAELRARDIVRRHGRGTLDYFALRDNKQFFFYGDSVVTYAVFGGIAVVSPDPIGPVADRTQVWAAFRDFCDAHAWGVGVIGAGVEWLPIYAASGMRYLYIGDEAIVDVQSFSLQGGKMKGLRQACTRMERNGYVAEFLDPAAIDPERIPGLIELMGLNRRGEGERGFSMMLGRLLDPKDQGLLLTIVSDAEGRPAAMCQFVPSPAINGFSLDLMRRDPGEHPNGLIDFALCSTIMHLKEEGATGLSLNFSAFRSTLDRERGDGITQRIERWGLKKLSSMLPIETLWKFNEKYQPSWLARHLVFSSPETFIPVAAAALRAESLTEIPVLGRFLAQDPANQPGTVVPPEILEAATSTEVEPPAPVD